MPGAVNNLKISKASPERKEKKGPPEGGPFDISYEIDLSRSAATSGAAGAAATASPFAHRVGRCNAKPGSRAGIDKFHVDGTTRVQQSFFYKELEVVVFKNLIVVLWLIQSQSQRGTGSTTLHQGNTEGRIDIILLHVFLEF